MHIATSSTRGPLSWQQTRQHSFERGERVSNVALLLALPDGISIEQLRNRLSILVAREESLRIIEFSRSGEGYVTYSQSVELPIDQKVAESAEELEAITSQMVHHSFARCKGLMWQVAVIEHPDNLGQHSCSAGKRTRSVYAVFDHLISDGRSRQLFRDDFMGTSRGLPGRQNGKYKDWVTWQREQFPMYALEKKTPAREFWRRHLDGTPPHRYTALSFSANTEKPPSGINQKINYQLPVSIEMLRSASGRLRSSPFLLFAAAVSSAIAVDSSANDITLQIVTNGRPSGFLNTLGWFSDCIPLRLQHRSLAVPDRALDAATSAWLDVVGFETTPWDYIAQVCGHSDAQPAHHLTHQVKVNFAPFGVERVSFLDVAESIGPGNGAGMSLAVAVDVQDKWCLECAFDPSWFRSDGVYEFLENLTQSLMSFCSR